MLMEPGVPRIGQRLQQARHVARTIAQDVRGKPPAECYRPFHYLDKGSMATIGRAAAVAQFGRLQLGGFFAWLMWLAVHIFFLITFRNRLAVGVSWLWNYLTFERGARLITGGPIPANQGE